MRAAAKKLDCMWKWLGKQNKTKNTTSARELKLLTQAWGKTKQNKNTSSSKKNNLIFMLHFPSVKPRKFNKGGPLLPIQKHTHTQTFKED